MNCGTCKHWNLSGEMGRQGYGRCDVHPNASMRAALSTSAQNVCRIKLYAKAPAAVVASRESAQGDLL